MKKNKHYFRQCSYGLLMLFGLAACKQPTVNLRLHLQKGQAFRLDTRSKQDITETQLGETIRFSQEITYGLQMEVLDTDKQGNYVLKSSYTHISFHQHSSMGNVDYDSDNKTDSVPPLIGSLANLLGSTFQMTLSPQGKVLHIQNLESLLEHSAAGAAGGNSSVTAKVMDSLQKYYGGQQMTQLIEGSWSIYPDKPVKEGDSWTKTQDIQAGMNLNSQDKYTLEEIGDKRLTIDLDSRISAPKNKTMGMEYNFSGAQKGILHLDRLSGLVTDANVEQDITGNVSRKDIGESVVVPMQIRSIVTYKASPIP